MSDTKKLELKTQLSDEDAQEIGGLLGYIESYAKSRARRWYSYVKGDVKNWGYDDTVHYGDLSKNIFPVLRLMIDKGYYIPILNEHPQVCSDCNEQKKLEYCEDCYHEACATL